MGSIVFAVVGNIFHSHDLPGEVLLAPLKAYHRYFMHKKIEGSGWTKVASIIMHMVISFFAYSVYGVVAFFGMVLKCTGIPFLYHHNNTRNVEDLRPGIKSSGAYSTQHIEEVWKNGYEMKTVKSFTVTPQNVDAALDDVTQIINECSWQMKKVYISREGSTQNGQGSIDVQLRVLSPI